MIYQSRKRQLSLAHQLKFLRSNPAVLGSGKIKARRLSWDMYVRPTALSRVYNVVIEYLDENTPNVFVRSPDLLQLAAGRTIPHVYAKPLRLCLHLPKTTEWSACSRIDKTIIPWTYLWLFYFEDWLASNDWKGGGKHPSDLPKPTGNRQFRRHLRKIRSHP